MEGKSVILSVLLMGLVMSQVQVEAKSCCPSTTARNIYNSCRLSGGSRPICATLSGCKIISGTTCPAGYDKLTLETDTHGSTALESQVNEGKQLIRTKVDEEQEKMEEFYSRISAAIESYNNIPKAVSCLPVGSPCAGLEGGNCCSNNCVFAIIGIPVGFCGTA